MGFFSYAMLLRMSLCILNVIVLTYQIETRINLKLVLATISHRYTV